MSLKTPKEENKTSLKERWHCFAKSKQTHKPTDLKSSVSSLMQEMRKESAPVHMKIKLLKIG